MTTDPVASRSSEWQFYRRMPVYLADGRRLGVMLEVGHGVDYLHVQAGRFLFYDWYVPISAVKNVTAEGIFLAVGREALRLNRWNAPPREFLARQGIVPGYEYTSAADIPPYGNRDPVPTDTERG